MTGYVIEGFVNGNLVVFNPRPSVGDVSNEIVSNVWGVDVVVSIDVVVVIKGLVELVAFVE